MHFSTLTFLLATLLTLVSAQNPFVSPMPESIPAGSPYTITWEPSTGQVDTVTLYLRKGDKAHLENVLTIASKVQNTGSYIWTPPTTLASASDYALEISDDGNSAIVNYSLPFAILSSNSGSSTVDSSPSSATVTGDSASGKATATASGSKTATGSASSTTSTPSGNAAAPPAGSGGLSGKVSVGMLVVVAGVMAAL